MKTCGNCKHFEPGLNGSGRPSTTAQGLCCYKPTMSMAQRWYAMLQPHVWPDTKAGTCKVYQEKESK